MLAQASRTNKIGLFPIVKFQYFIIPVVIQLHRQTSSIDWNFSWLKCCCFSAYKNNFGSIYIEWESFLADASARAKRFEHRRNLWAKHFVRLAADVFSIPLCRTHIHSDQSTHSDRFMLVNSVAFEGDTLVSIACGSHEIRAPISLGECPLGRSIYIFESLRSLVAHITRQFLPWFAFACTVV